MNAEPTKRCLLCGQTVPPNAVKCPACGKGRFEVEKRHAAGRAKALPADTPTSAGRPAPSRPRPAPSVPDGVPRGLFARLRSWFGGGG